MSKCKYCGSEITWKDEEGKHVPYDMAGRHRCQQSRQGPVQQPQQHQGTFDSAPTARTMTSTEENLIRALVEFIRQEASKK